MTLDLADYEKRARNAVKKFWKSRGAAQQRQLESGKPDQGERAGVTAGKNMDGFVELIVEVVKRNGLADAEIYQDRRVLTLPGYFRPTKLWDLLVMHEGRLIAALEFKSQVGPSFGNNFNNRAEEALGTAHDFWTAYREGAFGRHARPFLGWMILVEDAPKSRRPIRDRSPHFPVFDEFADASYLDRYDILCQRLIQEQLYTAACVLASPRSASQDGVYTPISELTGLKALVASFAGHIAAVAARE